MQRLRDGRNGGWPMWLDGAQARRRRPTEPGEVSRAWALGSDGTGEKLGLCAVGHWGTMGKVKHWIRRRSLLFCWENPSATFWFTRVETDCA